MPSASRSEPTLRFLGSLLALRFAAAFGVVGVLLLGIAVSDLGPSAAEREAAICETVERWRSLHGEDPRLVVARVDVRFDARNPDFTSVEGSVVVPAGIDLPGVQEIVDAIGFPAPIVTSYPVRARVQRWAYAGTVHRDMEFTALTLVRSGRDGAAEASRVPRALAIADQLAAYDARMRAEILQEHALHECSLFPRWAEDYRSDAPPEQIFREMADDLAEGLREESEPSSEAATLERHNICSAIRENSYTAHAAQVVLVMAARELGLEAFAFAGATPDRRHLAGVRTAALTWRVLDVTRPQDGYLDSLPPLLVHAALLDGATLADHDGWSALAVAHAATGYVFTSTEWADTQGRAGRDSTRVSSFPLAQGCR